jgi:hypothetical protein
MLDRDRRVAARDRLARRKRYAVGGGMMAHERLGFALGLAVLAAALAPGVARADAIDGHWCAADGRVMTIEGPAILTPGGHKVTGDYSRHAFSYVVPGGESQAGTTILMVLLNEETVELDPGDGAEREIWHRCDVIS